MKLKETVARAKRKLVRLSTVGAAIGATIVGNTSTALASDWGSVSVTAGSDTDATSFMGKILGILLTITRYVGVAMAIFGVYEIVMSFTQDMPDKRVKGVTLALAGVVMIGLKSIMVSVGILG